MSQLSDKARSVVRDLDPGNDLTFLRIRSKKHEIMVAPDKDFILIVIQNPTDWECAGRGYTEQGVVHVSKLLAIVIFYLDPFYVN